MVCVWFHLEFIKLKSIFLSIIEDMDGIPALNQTQFKASNVLQKPKPAFSISSLSKQGFLIKGVFSYPHIMQNANYFGMTKCQNFQSHV
jgi:hypothetical protein